MKLFKWLSFFVLALSLLLTFCACDDDGGTAKDSDTTTPPSEQPNPSPAECAHQYGEWIATVKANCTEKGLQTRACILCAKSETSYINELGHDEVVHEAKAPNCTEIGWDMYITCKRCDYTTYFEKDELGHHYENYYCIRCNNSTTSKGLQFTSNNDGTCLVSGID